MVMLMATNPRVGLNVGDLVEAAMREAGLFHKDMWIAQGYPDPSQWSKALHGQAPLDLWRMRALPIRFWQAFLPKFASALIVQMFDDLQVPLRMARSEIQEHEEKRRA